MWSADVPAPTREAPDVVRKADLAASTISWSVTERWWRSWISGTQVAAREATDLTTLQWYTFQDPLEGVRRLLWTRILDLAGWEGAAVLAAAQILLMLEVPIRHRPPRCRSRSLGQARPSHPRRAETAFASGRRWRWCAKWGPPTALSRHKRRNIHFEADGLPWMRVLRGKAVGRPQGPGQTPSASQRHPPTVQNVPRVTLPKDGVVGPVGSC